MSRAADRPGVERAVFDRHPVRVALPVERERLITLPAPAALHVPHDLDAVARIETIDRTIYVTALVP
ncbi:MAG: TIGR03749 family integrating conjugative element protein, partial [Hydrogenophaga sp.]